MMAVLLKWGGIPRSAMLNSDRIVTRSASNFGIVADLKFTDSRQGSGPSRSASVYIDGMENSQRVGDGRLAASYI